MPLKLAILALLAANLSPVIGVLYSGWNLSSVLFLYWFENVVIGFYNALKMLKAQQPGPGVVVSSFKVNGEEVSNNINMMGKIGTAVFFIAHYGIFTLVHGVFLFSMFIRDLHVTGDLLLSIGLLFISHGFSYYSNFIGKKEYERVSPQNLMMAPYKRILVMHITIIFGGMFITVTGGYSYGPLIILTLMKTFVDLLAHNAEHNRRMPGVDKQADGGSYHVEPAQ